MSSDPGAEEARRRHSKHHKKLSPKGRHATKQAQSLSASLHASLTAPDSSGAVNIAPAAKQVSAALSSLRRELSHSSDPKAKIAVHGLVDLESSFVKLAQATGENDPDKASRLLYSGFEALKSAQTNARKAGNVWPL